MSKEVKQMEFKALEKTFSGVRDLVLITPSKVDSATDFNFRKQLREKKVRVQMVKNSLVQRVFAAQGVKLDDKIWRGTTLVAWGADSIKDLSKAVDGLIKDIVKKDPKAKDRFVVKTAVADGQPVSMDMAMKMPTRLEAIGEIIAMILGPASEIAAALTGPAGQLASQIATIAEKKEEPAPAPAA
ncbi:MAG TPA: 50S ribosomal protein L10 [Gemmataceae bacterium]|nr:50S ribosomal protein L10 [Gemmataceae bacterium]